MWWRLSLLCPPELEESLVWKLNDLGLHRHALQHAQKRRIAERCCCGYLNRNGQRRIASS